MPSFAQDFRDFIVTQEPNKMNDSAIYSGSSHVHYGLSNPVMRAFVKTWSAQHPKLTYDDWQATRVPQNFRHNSLCMNQSRSPVSI